MPVTQILFQAWVPDTGDVGPDLAVADGLYPVHRSFRGVQVKQVQATLAGDGPVTGSLVHVFQQARQVEYARPSADLARGAADTMPTAAQPLWSVIDETTANDTDYWMIPNAPSGAVVTIQLSAITNPGTTSGHVYQFRYAVPATTGAWSIAFALLQEPAGTVIATNTVTGTVAQPGFTTASFNLTTGQAAAITNYADLALRWTATVPGSVQDVYPTADNSIGGWLVYPSGSSLNLWQVLATAPAQTAQTIVSKSLAVGASDTYTGRMGSTATDPITRDAHVLNTELLATNAGVTITVSILQGSTVVAQQVLTNAPTSPTPYAIAIPQATAKGISNYAQLTCSIVASYPADVPSTIFQSPGVPTATVPFQGFFPPAPLVSPPSSASWQVVADNTDSTYIYTTTGTGEIIFSVPSPSAPALSPTGYTLLFRASGTGGNVTVSLQSYTNSTITAITVTPTSGVTAFSHVLTASESAQVDALIPAGQPFQILVNMQPGVQVTRVEFDAAAPRAGVATFLQFAVPSTSALQVSWADYETPSPNTSYKGDVPTIYAGTKTKIYTVNQSAFTSVSASGGYGAGNANSGGWSFLQVGADCYATNYVDPIQARIGGSGNFGPLITDPSPAPQARHMAMVRQYLVLADINLTGYGPDWIWWGAAGNNSSFTPSLTTQAGNGEVNSTPGQIMALVGGDNGVIFKRNAVHSLTWTGDQSVFRLDEITRSVGTPYPRSVVLAEDVLYFWGGGCFWSLNPYSSADPVERVGDEVLAAYMADPITSPNGLACYDPPDMASEDQVMVGWYDRAAHLIFWEYQGLTDTPYQHSKRVCYSPTEDRWTSINGPVTSYGVALPTVSTSDTHLTRGTIGFDYNVVAANATSWYKFSGPTTLAITLKTQRRSLGLDKADMPIGPRQRGFTYVPDPKQDYEIRARVRDITPVWSSTSAAVSPQVSITVECSENPMVRPGSGSYRTMTTPWLSAGETYGFPVGLEGYWFIFTVNVAPISLPDMLYAFEGLYVSWDPKGRK
jgi:hypothetical protein